MLFIESLLKCPQNSQTVSQLIGKTHLDDAGDKLTVGHISFRVQNKKDAHLQSRESTPFTAKSGMWLRFRPWQASKAVLHLRNRFSKLIESEQKVKIGVVIATKRFTDKRSNVGLFI